MFIMISVNTFLEKISYREIVASVAGVMAENFEDFAADQARFREAVSSLENELKDGTSLSVSEAMDAVYQQVGSGLLFSCFLGFQANLDHFLSPVARTFLEVDPEVYLRENVAKGLPDYQNALGVLERFYAALSRAQKDRYEDITAYISHLETVGPKLAHYYGYILGNQLFPRVIPGYAADATLTLRYRRMLESYWGICVP